MDVTQALVLVGGGAKRLKAGGVSVPLSKAFMVVAGRPLLYWNLLLLHKAGIRRLVIAANTTALLYQAEKLIKRHPCKFARIDYFRDEGNGVHGIPYELRYLLDDTFVFECGHSIQDVSHYARLMRARGDYAAVFSAYRRHPKNLRQPVHIKKGSVLSLSEGQPWAIAHPIVATTAYARRLIEFDFTITNIIRHYSSMGGLGYVKSGMPPEYDIYEEMLQSHAAYAQYLAALDKISE